MRKRNLYLILSLLMAMPLAAQNVSVASAQGQDIEAFVRVHFLGSGVHVYNVRFNNTSGNVTHPQIGSFQSNGFSLMQMASGIVLTTGNVAVAEGPNSTSSASQTVGSYYTDPLMAAVSTGNLSACATLDFDFVCLSDHMSFTYSFGSEEYPEYVGSSFNDVFAFLLTGLDPQTGLSSTRNIALVPGSQSTDNPDGIAVAINSINPGVAGTYGYSYVDIHPEYSSFYLDNPEGSTGVQYDGFTSKLVASAQLVPCTPYHMHISICNVGDNNRDSGVMIEGNSLSSGSVSTRFSSGRADTVVRSVGRNVVLSLGNSAYPQGKVHLSFGGDLVNGVDFLCTTDSGAVIGSWRDHLFVDGGLHYFNLVGTAAADLSAPKYIEAYLATELCPLYPELLVYDTMRFVMVDDPRPTEGIGASAEGAVEVAVFPNPASGRLTVACQGLQWVDLLDATGRLLVRRQGGGGPNAELDLSAVPEGLYVVRAVTPAGIGTATVVKH